LLVGTTDGFTFEYRVDDVRLLGVRQGGFVERTDWTGRGGDAQKPLGKLVYLAGDGNPGPTYVLRDGESTAGVPATARFGATWARDGRAWLAYVLWVESGSQRTRRSWIEESPQALASAIGSGFARKLNVEDLGSGGRYSFCASRTKGAQVVASAGASAAESAPNASAPDARGGTTTETRRGEAVPAGPRPHSRVDWIARARPDGMFEIQLARGLAPGEGFASSGDELWLELTFEPSSGRQLEIVTLLAPAWDADVRAKWMKEIER
jgi:hypothetical protein